MELQPALAAPLDDLQPAQAATLDTGRGRSPARQSSPCTARRRSQESLTPHVSPPLSPTTVLPRSPSSKREVTRASPFSQVTPSQVLLQLCSPMVLLCPLTSPARPPGFEVSPTPPLITSGPARCTPSPVRIRKEAVALQPVGVGLALLFEAQQEALLPSPVSTPPRPAVARRKTLAGVDISRTGAGFSLHRTSARLKAAGRAKVPAARAAEILVCRSLGIVKDGEDVTAAALDAFVERFKEQLPPDVIVAMRGLFKLDDGQAGGIEDALILHSGAGAMDSGSMDGGAGAPQTAT